MRTWTSVRTSGGFRAIISRGSRGTKGSVDGLTIVVLRDPAAATAQAGLAVTASTAVARNRIKRRLRAALDVAAPAPGTALVLGGDPRLQRVSFQKLVDNIRRALEGSS